MDIEYPPAKRDATLAERGLDMARAAEIFDGDTLTVEDDRQDYGETRQITIGFLEGRIGGPGLDATRRSMPHHKLEESQ